MKKQIIKLDDIFKSAENLVKKILTNRFLLYKTIGAIAVVAVVSAAAFFAWNYFY